MFSAAKLLEATGEAAMAQDTEEWTHIQYFAAQPPTPTVLLDAGGFDADRMEELARAASSIGRIVIAVVPDGESAISQHADVVMPIKGKVRECFASLVYSIPGELIAAERAQVLRTQYFASFSGGRTVDWANGASRIYSSHVVEDVLR
jgi:glucosamine--fructose-6-phosphate aminotransferase (isomerizing)